MTEVILDHSVGDEFGLDFGIVPPPENPIPSTATEAEVLRNARRLAYEDSVRTARPKGNGAVIAFREKYRGNAEALLASLSVKDMVDVRADVLEDAMTHCGERFSRYRDCPRVSYEPVLPYFEEIGKGLAAASPEEILDWTLASIEVCDSLNPQGIYIPPVMVWRSRISDTRSRNIFFVAACRSKGVEARIDEVTGKTQYRDTGKDAGDGAQDGKMQPGDGAVWTDVEWPQDPEADKSGDGATEMAAQGFVKATYTPVSWLRDPLYYRHFTLSRIDGGSAGLLAFDESTDTGWTELLSEPLAVDAGYYLLTSGVRMADGSVSSHLEFFNVEAGMETEVPLVLKQPEDAVAVIGNINVEETFLPEGGTKPHTILSATGRGYFAMAVIKDFSEPSIHALRQLAAAADDLNGWGRSLVVLGADDEGCGRMGEYLSGIDKVHYGTDPDGRIQKMLYDGCMQENGRLPVIIIADSFGRVVYYSQGYNTSLSEQLRTVISRL